MKCPCVSINKSEVLPCGSDQPDVYIVGEAPREDDNKVAFGGSDGSILRSAISESKVDASKIRLGYAVCCRPSYDSGKNRPATYAEIENCSEFVKHEIRNMKPKTIVCLGKAALTAFVPDYNESVAKALKTNFSWEGIPVKVFYSPSYINRKGGTRCQEFQGLVRFIRNLFGKDSVAKIPATTIFSTKEECADLLNTLISKGDRVGFDIETNGYPPHTEPFEIFGIGFATGENLWYYDVQSQEDLRELRPLFAEYLSKVENLVFNMSYEGIALGNVLKLSIHQMNLVDVRQWAVVKQELSGLKNLAQLRLGFPDWSKEIDEFVNPKTGHFNELISLLKPTKRYPRKEYGDIEDKGATKYLQSLIDRKNSQLNDPKSKKKLSAREDQLMMKLHWVKQVFSDEKEFDSLLRKILSEAISDRKIAKEVYFEWLPVNMVGPYCGTDCYATLKLFDDYMSRSTDKEQNAFWKYQTHAKLAVQMESDAICWDDQYADELAVFYDKQRIEHLRKIIIHPLFAKANEFSIVQLVEMRTARSLDKLKNVYNPGSNHVNSTSMFKKALATERFRLGMIFYHFYQQHTNGELDVGHPMWTTISTMAKEEKFVTRKGFFEAFLNDEPSKNFVRNQAMVATGLNSKLLDPNSNPIEGLDSSNIETFYNMFTFIGNDINDPSTWDSEFDLLFHFRYCKKVTKALTSYIEGNMGRRAVYVVDKATLSDPVPVRRGYTPKIGAEQLHVLQSSYNNNGAETRRWKSPQHTIPWNCELRDIQTSRWGDGILLHVDYSQMEVRTMAALADEAAMLQAFIDGKDIHRFVASRIFKKSEDEVLTEERRFAKMATFSLLYGKHIWTFAMDFMKGDLAAAEKLFADFFAEFPNLKRFIDNCHNMLHTLGYIETIFGDRIYISYDADDKKDKEAAERHAQNYGIQSSASNLAAEGLHNTGKDLFGQGIDCKIFGFTHDSGDFDTHVQNLLPTLSTIRRNMETNIHKEYNVPVAVDYELGLKGNSMLTLEIEKLDDTMLVAEFKATEQAFNETSALMKRVLGNKVDFQLHGTAEEDFQSMEFLFVAKRAFSKYLGQNVPKVKGKIALVA